jgi:phosphohistidine phosphatase
VKDLFLLRHAKSSWADTSLPDHDRPLAPRGTKATRALARHLRESNVRPALVLCSTAVRARQTLDGVSASLGDDVDIWFEDDLYGATDDELLDRVRRLPAAVPSVMVVGHNPGLEDLALTLIGGGDERALAHLHTKFPTGALASLLLPADWKNLGAGEARLTGYVVPRDLP